MKTLIKKWLILSVGIFLASYFLEGFQVTSVTMIIVGALILGLLNVTIKPLLLLLTLPLNIITLGLFTIVINGVILYLAGSVLRGWQISSFGTAILASLIISAFSMLVNFIFKDK